MTPLNSCTTQKKTQPLSALGYFYLIHCLGTQEGFYCSRWTITSTELSGERLLLPPQLQNSPNAAYTHWTSAIYWRQHGLVNLIISQPQPAMMESSARLLPLLLISFYPEGTTYARFAPNLNWGNLPKNTLSGHTQCSPYWVSMLLWESKLI